MNTATASPRQPARTSRSAWLAAALLAALLGAPLVGCEEPAQITTYETPRTEPLSQPVDAEAVRGLLDHMFTAVVPADGKAWFFKLVVPDAVAAEVRKPFHDFVATVNAAAGGELPAWSLPEGWTQREGKPTPMRAATIVVPHKGRELELTVSSLPMGDDWDDFLKANVDRWMGQLGQPELSSATIAKLQRRVATAAGDATVLELVGKMKPNPMGMAGMPAGHPPLGDASQQPEASADETTASSPDSPAEPPASGASASAPDGGAQSSGGLTYTLPEGWRQGPPSPMRKASFVIGQPGAQAEVSITAFPAFGEMAAVRANAVRWAGEVGIADLSDEQITAATSEIEIEAAAAHRFELFSAGDAPRPLGILAAMAVRGETVWFIKLKGDRQLVESQGKAFDQFLASLKLPTQ